MWDDVDIDSLGLVKYGVALKKDDNNEDVVVSVLGKVLKEKKDTLNYTLNLGKRHCFQKMMLIVNKNCSESMEACWFQMVKSFLHSSEIK